MKTKLTVENGKYNWEWPKRKKETETPGLLTAKGELVS